MVEIKEMPKVQDNVKLKEICCFLAEDRACRDKIHLLVTTVVNINGEMAVVDLTDQSQFTDIWSEDTTISEFCEEKNLAFIKGYDDERTFKITFEEI